MTTGGYRGRDTHLVGAVELLVTPFVTFESVQLAHEARAVSIKKPFQNPIFKWSNKRALKIMSIVDWSVVLGGAPRAMTRDESNENNWKRGKCARQNDGVPRRWRGERALRGTVAPQVRQRRSSAAASAHWRQSLGGRQLSETLPPSRHINRNTFLLEKNETLQETFKTFITQVTC